MLSYVLRRALGAIPTLFIIIAISFFMIRLAPGGPFDRERRVLPEIEAALGKAYHMDEPLPMQFARYLGGLAIGDMGPSFAYRDHTVSSLIATGFPTSFQLGGMAVLLALTLGVAAGTIAALRQNSWLDYFITGTAMIGNAVPNFVVAPVLTLVFGLLLGWLPVGGWGKPGGFILPVVALTLPLLAIVSRLMRASMIEVLTSNYVRTARAKGLPERITLTRHAIRAALVPIVSYIGPAIANAITGSIVIEQIFGIPGIGRYFIQSALNRDYTMVMGVTVFYGGLIILCNLLADIVYGLLDPKIRYE